MSLDINKQKMTYALPTGQQPKYELDYLLQKNVKNAEQ